MHACVLSCLSHVQLFTTSGTVAHQAFLSTGLSRQEYWSVLPRPPAGDLPDPGIELAVSSISCIGRWIFHHLCHLGSPKLTLWYQVIKKVQKHVKSESYFSLWVEGIIKIESVSESWIIDSLKKWSKYFAIWINFTFL